MPVLYARWRNTRRRRLAERLTFETCILKLPSWHRNNPEARHCDAGVTQNLPTLTKLTSLTVLAGSDSTTYAFAT